MFWHGSSRDRDQGSAELRTHLHKIMAKLKLTLNKDKTRMCRVPDGNLTYWAITTLMDVFPGHGHGWGSPRYM
ncbi:MAG: hypothetical protein J2P48_17145 [Alphaproteobacteria bacterium]|nr:hypothetical protein [Alphaproteobacteria bacterium]